MSKVEQILEGVVLDHTTIDNKHVLYGYHTSLVDHLSFDEDLGFLVIHNKSSDEFLEARRAVLDAEVAETGRDVRRKHSKTTYDASSEEQSVLTQPDERIIHMLAFGLPQYVKDSRGNRTGGIERLVTPITKFRDLNPADQTIGKQGKGVGFRLYNAPWALKGTAENPDEVVAYSLEVPETRVLDLHRVLDTGRFGYLKGVSRHGGRIALTQWRGIDQIRREAYGELTDKDFEVTERVRHLPEYLGRLRHIPSEGLEDVVDGVHAGYDQRLKRRADVVILPQPPRGSVSQHLRGAESVPEISEELLIVRNSLIKLRKEGIYRP